VNSLALIATTCGANIRAFGFSCQWAPLALPGRLAARFTGLHHLNLEIYGPHMLAGLEDLAFASNLKSLQIHLLTEEPCAFSLAALESLKDLRIVRNPPSSLEISDGCKLHLGFTHTEMPDLLRNPGVVSRLTSLLLCLSEPLRSDSMPELFRQPFRVKYLSIYTNESIGSPEQYLYVSNDLCPMLARAEVLSLEAPSMYLSVPPNAGIAWSELKLRACDAAGYGGVVGLQIHDPGVILGDLEACEVTSGQLLCSNLSSLAGALLAQGKVFAPTSELQDPAFSKVYMLRKGQKKPSEAKWQGCEFHCMACRWCLKAEGKLCFSSEFMGHIV